MIIIGIETSCDETAVALLRRTAGQTEILAEEISSQSEIHEAYGGVVPELASREHLRNLPLLYDKVLSDSGVAVGDLSAIGVTHGPGLKGCLLIGAGFARGLALAQNIPLFGVNHIEGHLLAPMLDSPELKPPYLALVVSGGHTEIVEVRGVGEYQIIARTTDDAAGEAFDKSAHLLGLAYPGGPRLAALADLAGSTPFKLPRVMRSAEGFSFSGLKTAISLLVRDQGDRIADPAVLGQLAFAVQEAIVDALVFKLKEALKGTPIRDLVLTGGVSRNLALQQTVSAISGARVWLAKPEHCTDNAAMIGYAAALRLERGETGDREDNVRARWGVEELR